VVAANTDGTDGIDPGDVAWVLDHAAGEIEILRPAHDERLAESTVAAAGIS
jgi:hypothetical protein